MTNEAPQSFNPSGDGTKLCASRSPYRRKAADRKAGGLRYGVRACILTFPYKRFWLEARSSGEADLR